LSMQQLHTHPGGQQNIVPFVVCELCIFLAMYAKVTKVLSS